MSRELRINTTAFDAALNRFMQHSKRDAEVVLRQQARGLMKSLIDVTPPGGRNVSNAKARARGINSLKADAFKVVEVVSPKRAEETKDVESLISRHRVQGRVKQEVTPRILVSAAALRAYLKKQQAKVGFLASGWNQAASKLGFKPSAWIWNNRGPGAVVIEINDRRIAVRATNRVKFEGA